MEAHEKLEQAENTEHVGGVNKKIALLIAIMALFLRFPRRSARAPTRKRSR